MNGSIEVDNVGVYEELGLRPIINASGAVTRLGGAPMSDAVLAAYCDAARAAVPLEQLQAAASRAIAEAAGAEAGLVTGGAAAAVTLGAAAILTGFDLGRMEQLPQCQGFPDEFVVAREHRNGYDHAVRAAGGRLVEVGFHELVSGAGVRRVEAWEYEAAFSPRSAGVFYVLTGASRPPLAEVIERAHAHQLPVLVDAAGELPPRANLRALVATGADLVAFSGGKAIGGPQATGILCGKRPLVGAAALQMLDMDDHAELWQPPDEWFAGVRLPGMPRHGIGRGFKVSKEQIVSLLVALKEFTRGDFVNLRLDHCRRLTDMVAELKGLPAQFRMLDFAEEQLPKLEIALDERALGRTAFEVCRALRAGAPPCYVGHARLADGMLIINPLHLNDQTTMQLAQRIREELTVKP